MHIVVLLNWPKIKLKPILSFSQPNKRVIRFLFGIPFRELPETNLHTNEPKVHTNSYF